jgi:hypothetical protein
LRDSVDGQSSQKYVEEIHKNNRLQKKFLENRNQKQLVVVISAVDPWKNKNSQHWSDFLVAVSSGSFCRCEEIVVRREACL